MTSFDSVREVYLDGKNLNIETIFLVANAPLGKSLVYVTEKSLKDMHASNDYVNKIVRHGMPVYGINTGFGALANKHIPTDQLKDLQYNLIRSHCTGVGDPFDIPVTRAIMLLRANCLVQGHSGITPEAVQRLLDFINHGVTPIVPCKGSVGASGDLAPLAHIALCLIGEGEVLYKGRSLSAKEALQEIKKDPVELGPKDGLALINGTAVMAALGAIACYQSERLMKIADICGAYTLEGVKGTRVAFDPKITMLKPHPGQIQSVKNLNLMLPPSEISESHTGCEKVQDPYSLRCIPQVHGACRQTLDHAEKVVSTELNSVTDNPLIFIEEGEVISGGNFHGEALAFCMDYLSMGMAELCSISERRIEKMMNPTFSDLPHFLIENSGVNSGLMIAHVTAAALASENKFLCHPASVDSIPTSTDKEDHVSMGVTAGRKVHEVIENLKNCLAIELLCASQAMEFQRPLKSTPALEAVHSVIRKHIPPIKVDRVFHKDISKLIKLIENGDILTAVENITGELE